MTHKIKVQDGKIEYSSTDPGNPFEMDIAGVMTIAKIVDVGNEVNEVNVAGTMNVTTHLTVGNDPGAPGEITTEIGQDLMIKPGDGGQVNVVGSMDVTQYLKVGNAPGTPGEITTEIGQDLILKPGVSGDVKLSPENGRIVLDTVIWPDNTITAVPGMLLGVKAQSELGFYSVIMGTALTDTETTTTLNASFPNSTPGQVVLGPTVMYYATGAGNWRIISALPV